MTERTGARFTAIIAMALILNVNLAGQSSEELRTIFTEAESHYLYGEFELANPLYLILNDYIPGNANLSFKIGDCYLNIPDERSKAIPFLEIAAREADASARSDNFRETKAPLEAWFSLATAYRINNELDKALNTYQTYLRLVTEADIRVNTDFINQQIAACRNAIRQMEEPVGVEKINLGPVINQGSVNFNPAVSYDGNSMVFTENRGLENAIFYTIKDRGVWQTPIDVTGQLGNARDCHATSLNADGTELYLYKLDNFDGNIYVSRLVDGAWTKIRKLNRNINTRYYESHAAISFDGGKLYFTSNRPGGQGELDIYVSERGSGDNWGPAVNLGPTINTPFNEDTPFVTEDGKTLFFASEGHNSMGGYDIYKSHWLGESWLSPENLGYPINTTDDDLFFQPAENGESGYYSLYTDYKKKEIFNINIGERAMATNFEIRGVITLADTTLRFAENFAINLINLVRGDTLDTATPNDFTGLYTFITRPGTYRLLYKGAGYITETRDTTITASHPSKSVRIDVTLNPDPSYKPDFITERIVYEKIDLASIPSVSKSDAGTLVTDVLIRDIGYTGSEDDQVLYYTVQVMALHNPVDISYFSHINDMVVVYNDSDKFYRYTAGRFRTREEAYAYRLQLIAMGYPDDIFIKKVFRE
ncbi:MAG: hypothetical protein R6W67_13060 [Bacteroidales bacterium]